MIEATSGYALTFEGLTFPSESNHLVFCPLEPAVTSSTYLIWKKDTPLSKSAQIFLELVKEAVGDQKDWKRFKSLLLFAVTCDTVK